MSDDRKIEVDAADVVTLRKWHTTAMSRGWPVACGAIDRIIAAYEEQTTPPWEPDPADVLEACRVVCDGWASAHRADCTKALQFLHDVHALGYRKPT